MKKQIKLLRKRLIPIINEHKLHLDDLISEIKNRLNSQWEDKWKQKDSNYKDITDNFFENQKTS